MRVKVKDYDGEYVWIQLFPDNDNERESLIAFKNSRANDSQELTVMDWVEKALLREGQGKHSVVGFEGVQNNVYYVFHVQHEGGLGGY